MIKGEMETEGEEEETKGEGKGEGDGGRGPERGWGYSLQVFTVIASPADLDDLGLVLA